MSQPQDSSLLNVFATVPDPRHARGKQVAWVVMLGVIASALLSQQQRAAAMAQWAQAHAGPLVAAFRRGAALACGHSQRPPPGDPAGAQQGH